MRVPLPRLWWQLRGSFWFLPAVIVSGSAIFAVLMTEVDSWLPRELLIQWPRLFGAGTEGSRAMLSAVAGSMVTVATVTFSITMLALSQASSQYSPRLLQRFMSDRPTQVVLGVFVGVFVYCIIVLRTIKGGDEGAFLPSVSVTIAGVLALLGIGVLVYFIHHIASSLQASTIIASVGVETLETIDGLVGSGDRDEKIERLSARMAAGDPRECTEIVATCHGYLATVDVRRFVKLAAESRAEVQFRLRFGDFAHKGDTVAKVRSDRTLTSPVVERMQAAVGMADRRSNQQDPGFGLQQLTDIALKALSPGVNDPTTALMALNFIGAILAKLAHQQIRPQVFCDEEGEPRLHIPYPDFDEYVDASFSPIRAAAGANLAVLRSLVLSIDRARQGTTDERRLRSLLRLLEQVARASGTISEPDDRKALDRTIGEVRLDLARALRAEETA